MDSTWLSYERTRTSYSANLKVCTYHQIDSHKADGDTEIDQEGIEKSYQKIIDNNGEISEKDTSAALEEKKEGGYGPLKFQMKMENKGIQKQPKSEYHHFADKHPEVWDAIKNMYGFTDVEGVLL